MDNFHKQKSIASQIFRDRDDVRVLLRSIDAIIEAQSSDKEAREALLHYFSQTSAANYLPMLYERARGFALMLDDITAALARWQVALGGEIQVTSEKLAAVFGSQTTWARSEEVMWSDELRSQAYRMTSELMALANRVRVTVHTRKTSNEHITSTGEAFERSVTGRMLMELGIARELTHAKVFLESRHVSAADIAALVEIQNTLRELSSRLSGLPALPMANDAINAFMQRVERELVAVNAYSRIAAGANAALAALPHQVAEVGRQLISIVERSVVGVRAATQLRTFKRCEFWPARWRIYEVWVLVSSLTEMERAGWSVDLCGVESGIWVVSYTRNDQPVAVCRKAGRTITAYYQLYQTADESAAMPDIALFEGNGLSNNCVAIIDPKHGPSHSRNRVHAVGEKYRATFHAAFTAIVNYTHVPSYAFDLCYLDSEKMGLISGLQPRSVNFSRFALHLQETLMMSQALPETVQVERSALSPAKAPPRHSLFYWAEEDNEIDEPAGLWQVGSDLTPKYIEGFSKVMLEQLALSTIPNIRLFSVNEDASRLLLVGEKHLIHLDRGGFTRLPCDEKAISAVTWCRCGKHALLSGGSSKLLVASSPLSILDMPYVSSSGAKVYVWSSDCTTIYKIDAGLCVHKLVIPTDKRDRPMWEKVCSARAHFDQLRYSAGKDSSGVPHTLIEAEKNDFSSSKFQIFMFDSETGAIRAQGELTDRPVRIPYGVAPNADLAIAPGPKSRRPGVTLLEVVTSTRAVPFPLIRTSAEPNGDFRWSPDGAAFAFHERGRAIVIGQPGERYASTISLPYHAPAGFAWLRDDFARLRFT